MRRAIWLVTAIIALVAIGSILAILLPPFFSNTVAERPRWMEGQFWIYENTYPEDSQAWQLVVVDNISDQDVLVNQYSYVGNWMVDEYGEIRLLNMSQGAISPSIYQDRGAPYEIAHFPLEDGKQWSSDEYDFEVTDDAEGFVIDAQSKEYSDVYYSFTYSVEHETLVKLEKYSDFYPEWKYELVESGDGVDTDGDRLPDLAEMKLGTDWNLSDTDDDGEVDNWDLYPLGEFSWRFEIGEFSLDSTDEDENGTIDPYLRITRYNTHAVPWTQTYSPLWNQSSGNFSTRYWYSANQYLHNSGYNIEIWDSDLQSDDDRLTGTGLSFHVLGWEEDGTINGEPTSLSSWNRYDISSNEFIFIAIFLEID